MTCYTLVMIVWNGFSRTLLQISEDRPLPWFDILMLDGPIFLGPFKKALLSFRDPATAYCLHRHKNFIIRSMRVWMNRRCKRKFRPLSQPSTRELAEKLRFLLRRKWRQTRWPKDDTFLEHAWKIRPSEVKNSRIFALTMTYFYVI